jgi:hypothetical protein
VPQPETGCRIFLNRSQTVSITKPVTPVTFAAVGPEKRGFSLPVPPPAPPKASSGCFVGAVAVVALLGFGLLATLLSVVDDERAPPGTTGATTAPPAAGAVLLTEQGAGRLTAVLTSGTAWDLHWSFDCSGRPAASGRFTVELHGPVRLSGVDERGARGHGTEHAAAGSYRLTVHSPCPWALTAVTT